MEVPEKAKNIIPICSCNSSSGHISRENYNLKRYMHPSVHSSTMYNSQDMEANYPSTDKWINKVWY